VDDDSFRSALHILHWAVALARNADDEVAERARGLQAYTVVVVQSSPGAAELATARYVGTPRREKWRLDVGRPRLLRSCSHLAVAVLRCTVRVCSGTTVLCMHREGST
jgi:hypothetical protein